MKMKSTPTIVEPSCCWVRVAYGEVGWVSEGEYREKWQQRERVQRYNGSGYLPRVWMASNLDIFVEDIQTGKMRFQTRLGDDAQSLMITRQHYRITAARVQSQEQFLDYAFVSVDERVPVAFANFCKGWRRVDLPKKKRYRLYEHRNGNGNHSV